MSSKTRTITLPLLTTALATTALTAVLATTASAHQAERLKPPLISAAAAAAITEARLPGCTVTDIQLYHDDDRPMWFADTECDDHTWKDVRIDGTTGRVIAVNGDYDV